MPDIQDALRGELPARLVALVPTPRRNPFALGYLAVLLGTTLFARFGDPDLVHRLQALSSTDGHNLIQFPITSLFFSGLWVAGPVWTPYLWAFAFTVAPLERRVGGWRAAVVFATGHVVATLLSQFVVAVSVALGELGPDALDNLDIGVSYGVLATLGAVAGLLRPRARLLALAGAGGMIGHQLLTDQDLVTAVGHPAALLVGISLWRWLRRGPGRPWRLRRAVLGRVSRSEGRLSPSEGRLSEA